MDIMTVEQIEDEITNVILNGRLDSVGAASVAQRFTALVGGKKAVIVDLSGVEYVASLAIRFLVAGAKAVKTNGGKLILLSPDEFVDGVLKTAGIDQVISIMFDRDAAIAAVRPPAAPVAGGAPGQT
jgi:anti-anti-sigma factor